MWKEGEDEDEVSEQLHWSVNIVLLRDHFVILSISDSPSVRHEIEGHQDESEDHDESVGLSEFRTCFIFKGIDDSEQDNKYDDSSQNAESGSSSFAHFLLGFSLHSWCDYLRQESSHHAHHNDWNDERVDDSWLGLRLSGIASDIRHREGKRETNYVVHWGAPLNAIHFANHKVHRYQRYDDTAVQGVLVCCPCWLVTIGVFIKLAVENVYAHDGHVGAQNTIHLSDETFVQLLLDLSMHLVSFILLTIQWSKLFPLFHRHVWELFV